ncbi:MAG TPA: hypothetical protein P5181_02560 [Dermatophilaceae bacterium]|nr:hypothetical protein [Dermatophilaceae bacterium]
MSADGPSDRVVLEDRRDADGTVRSLVARAAEGGIRIEGQDLGPGVERFFGPGLTEYEWSWWVPPVRVAALVARLGGEPGADPLATLAAFHREGGEPLSQALKDPAVDATFWSRVGD